MKATTAIKPLDISSLVDIEKKQHHPQSQLQLLPSFNSRPFKTPTLHPFTKIKPLSTKMATPVASYVSSAQAAQDLADKLAAYQIEGTCILYFFSFMSTLLANSLKSSKSSSTRSRPSRSSQPQPRASSMGPARPDLAAMSMLIPSPGRPPRPSSSVQESPMRTLPRYRRLWLRWLPGSSR